MLTGVGNGSSGSSIFFFRFFSVLVRLSPGLDCLPALPCPFPASSSVYFTKPRSFSGPSSSVSGLLIRLLRQASIVFRLFLFRFRPLPSALTSLDRFPALSLPCPASSVCFNMPRSSSGSFSSVSGLFRLL